MQLQQIKSIQVRADEVNAPKEVEKYRELVVAVCTKHIFQAHKGEFENMQARIREHESGMVSARFKVISETQMDVYVNEQKVGSFTDSTLIPEMLRELGALGKSTSSSAQSSILCSVSPVAQRASVITAPSKAERVDKESLVASNGNEDMPELAAMRKRTQSGGNGTRDAIEKLTNLTAELNAELKAMTGDMEAGLAETSYAIQPAEQAQRAEFTDVHVAQPQKAVSSKDLDGAQKRLNGLLQQLVDTAKEEEIPLQVEVKKRPPVASDGTARGELIEQAQKLTKAMQGLLLPDAAPVRAIRAHVEPMKIEQSEAIMLSQQLERMRVEEPVAQRAVEERLSPLPPAQQASTSFISEEAVWSEIDTMLDDLDPIPQQLVLEKGPIEHKAVQEILPSAQRAHDEERLERELAEALANMSHVERKKPIPRGGSPVVPPVVKQDEDLTPLLDQLDEEIAHLADPMYVPLQTPSAPVTHSKGPDQDELDWLAETGPASSEELEQILAAAGMPVTENPVEIPSPPVVRTKVIHRSRMPSRDEQKEMEELLRSLDDEIAAMSLYTQ